MQVPNELVVPWERHARPNPEVVPWADLTLDWWEWLSGVIGVGGRGISAGMVAGSQANPDVIMVP